MLEGVPSSTMHLPKWTQRQLLEPVELGPGAKLASTVASVLHSFVVMGESRIRRGEIHEHCSSAADVAPGRAGSPKPLGIGAKSETPDHACDRAFAETCRRPP